MDLGHGVEGVLAQPSVPVRAAVLVLSGSSGRVDADRARLFADYGALALALKWFGGEGQPPGICEVPLETITAALDLLQRNAPGARLGIVGTSKGAEAALAVAVRDDRVDAVVGLAAPDAGWANVGPGLDGEQEPQRSSWTWRGEPLPYIAYDQGWEPSTGEPMALTDLYSASHRLDPARTARARLAVEDARADLLLIAGEDDQMWPAAQFARAIERARTVAGRQVELVTSPDAGHRILFPGEPDLPPPARFRYGGNDDADRELGARAWRRALELLGLASSDAAQ